MALADTTSEVVNLSRHERSTQTGKAVNLLQRLHATGESDKAELYLAKKQRQQIRSVRFEHFGNTVGEAAMKGCSEMPVGGRHNDKFFSMLSHVVCPVCKTRTNGASAGDLCRACKTGIFEHAQ
ncbi:MULTISPECIES: hypothetical protein [Comamonas]|uniref:hypothetical protein n=1 Tax=Comamonas TaxID=283 RepID=UPI0015FD4C3F|nr:MULTISPECIES: hypothetical protein [Comamonas]UUC96595.1 hypothetical protein NOX35_27175 [Comamonas sp. C11]